MPGLEWSAREQPLAVEGCWAEGAVAQELLAKVRSRRLPGLRGATEGGRLVLLGSDLPWVEGVVYLGRQGSVYLPTLWQPNLPVAWLAARLEKLGPPPWALLPPCQAMGLSAAGVLS